MSRSAESSSLRRIEAAVSSVLRSCSSGRATLEVRHHLEVSQRCR